MGGLRRSHDRLAAVAAPEALLRVPRQGVVSTVLVGEKLRPILRRAGYVSPLVGGGGEIQDGVGLGACGLTPLESAHRIHSRRDHVEGPRIDDARHGLPIWPPLSIWGHVGFLPDRLMDLCGIGSFRA